jgi:type III secretion system YscQ/HrcQ family protein
VTEYKPLPDISVLEFDLPDYSPADIAALTALPVKTTSYDFSCGPAGQMRLTLDCDCVPGSIHEEIDLIIDQAALTVRLEKRLSGPLLALSGYAGSPEVIAQDPPTAGLVLEHFLTPTLEQLERGEGFSLQIRQVAESIPKDDPVLSRLRFKLESALWETPCVGELVATSPIAAEFLRARFARALPLPGPARLDLHVPCSLLSGETTVRQADLAAMVPGDGLLLPPTINLQSPLYLRFSHQKMARVDWRDKELVVTGLADIPSPHEETHAMQSFDDDSITIDDLPVTISLELDRIEISFASLADLHVGSVIPFSIGKPQKVRVLANGRGFATADLLQIDGRLGVRISALAPRPE